MSQAILASAAPTQARVKRYLNDSKALKLPDPPPAEVGEKISALHTYVEAIRRLQTHLDSAKQELVAINSRSLEAIAQADPEQQETEKQAYLDMAARDDNLLTDIDNATEMLVELNIQMNKTLSALGALQTTMTQPPPTVSPITSNTVQTSTPIQSSPPAPAQNAVNQDVTLPYTQAQTQPTPTTSLAQLPKIKLLEFAGDIKDWPAFWNTFEQVVDFQPLSDMLKLTYLVSLLKGEAKDMIAGFSIRPENYGVVVQTLKAQYAQDGRLRADLYKQLQQITPVTREHDLPATWRKMETILRQLDRLGDNTNHPQVETALEAKLPYNLLKEIYRKKLVNPTWNVSQLRELVATTVSIREHAQDAVAKVKPEATARTERQQKPQQARPNNLQVTTMAAPAKLLPQNKGRPKKRCAFCSEEHYSDECKRFSTPATREERVKALNLCFRCLGNGHRISECKNRARPCYHCKGTHASALCKRKQLSPAVARNTTAHTTVEVAQEATATPTTEQAITMATSGPSNDTVLLMCAEVTVQNGAKPAQQVTTLAFFDSGSQRSYIEESLTKRLGLKKTQARSLLISTFGAMKPRKVPTRETVVEIKLQDGTCMPLQLRTAANMTQKLEIADLNQNPLSEQALQNAPRKWRQPELLIGADYFFDFVKEVRRSESGYYLISTTVGPILAGDNHSKRCEANSSSYMSLDVNQFWDLDVVGITDADQEEEDEEAYRHFKETIIREPTGRYCVKWPWRTPEPQLSNNWGKCIGRVKSMLAKFRDKPQLLQQYHDTFLDQLKNGIIEVAPSVTQTLVHYLPHQAVITPNKATTKLRVVFDASAKAKTGQSLNEALYRGPVILPQLCGILLRARAYCDIVVADVEKAFLQIGLQESDRDVTRFIWVKDITKPPEGANLVTYRFTRLPFGAVSSPFLLAAVLQYHLEQGESALTEAIKENLYVDNVLIGLREKDDPRTIYEQSKNLFESAKMNLRQYSSNEWKVMEAIPEHDRNTEEELSLLGLPWNAEDDELLFELKPQRSIATKRELLRFIAGHFDPLGLISPVFLQWKTLCQEMWKQRLQWDDEIPAVLVQQLTELQQSWRPGFIIVPRPAMDIERTIQLHVFVDASQKGFAATVYARTSYETHCEVDLIFCKQRLMPIKALTIPKAELMGALIGSRALQYVKRELKLQHCECYAWSDSKCVLGWLATNKVDHLPRFVKNRVSEISQTGLSFRYVPTSENPADIATRGISADELRASELWWHGPTWLLQDAPQWPKDEEEPTTVTVTQVHTIVSYNQDFIDVERFSSWRRLLGTVKTVWLFSQKTCKRLSRTRTPTQELNTLAEASIIKMAQQTITSEEQHRWRLRQDEHGIWRVHDRLGEGPNSGQNQIYLPRSHSVTKLLILHEHEKQAHAGLAHTLCNFRMTYWVEKGRSLVKQILHKHCLSCRRWTAKPFRLPEMAPLPTERLSRSRPFEHTAIDYAGPFNVKNQQGSTEKRWICLFTCLATRAVHLESVNGLSTPQFLEAFRKFTARRGSPTTLLSDNGTQFKAAAEYISAQWRNITAKAPWKGGVYERLIGLMKNIMKRTLGKRLLHEQQWDSVIINTEGVLNNRPLCQLSDESNEVLRPIDFLMPRVAMTEDIKIPASDDYLPTLPTTCAQVQKYFSNTEKYLDQLWNVWVKEYLQYLRERSASDHKQSRSVVKRPPRKGEIVLIAEENLPRHHWPLASIIEVHESKDGQIRTVTIKTPEGRSLKRALNQIYPLEIRNDTLAEGRAAGDANLEAEAPEEDEEIRGTFGEDSLKTNAFPSISSGATRPIAIAGKIPFFLLLVMLSTARALIAYDCGHANLNITTIDSTRVGICNKTTNPPVITTARIQLLQLADSYPVEVVQCKVVVRRHVTICGMFSHGAEVAGGHMTYVAQIGEAQCRELIKTKSLQIQGNIWFHDLEMGKIHIRNTVLVGSLDKEGHCSGGSYADDYGSWQNVVVQATYTITTESYHTMAYPGANEIRLRSQLVCKYSAGFCMDLYQGETFWRPTEVESCSRQTHVVLYEGLANVMTIQERDVHGRQITTYSVETGEKIFALRRTTQYTACAFTVWRTEHPKLVIAHSSGGEFYFKRTEVPNGALDLMAYMNAKFVYIDKVMGRNTEEAFEQLSYQRCQAERKAIKTLLAIATSNPADFAYAYLDRPGYTANMLGEVIHVIQCVPVEVTVRSTKRCFSELPITWNNQSAFMTPKTRLIQHHGSEIACNPFLRPMYRLHDEWYTLTPQIVRTEPPKVLQPAEQTSFHYTSPKALATGGIYNTEEVNRLRTQVMYPIERAAITDVMARGLSGQHPDFQGLSISRMIDESTVEKIRDGIITKLWGGFTFLGNLVSGLVGIYAIFRITKWAADTLLHFTILYDLYGLSVILIGSAWDSVTNFLVHRRAREILPTRQKRRRADTMTKQQEGEVTRQMVAPTPDDAATTPVAENGEKQYPALHTLDAYLAIGRRAN